MPLDMAAAVLSMRDSNGIEIKTGDPEDEGFVLVL
jgi:hypothetical protein